MHLKQYPKSPDIIWFHRFTKNKIKILWALT